MPALPPAQPWSPRQKAQARSCRARGAPPGRRMHAGNEGGRAGSVGGGRAELAQCPKGAFPKDPVDRRPGTGGSERGPRQPRAAPQGRTSEGSGTVCTDAVRFVSLFFLVSPSVPPSRSLLSGHRLVLRLLGSHLHRTYLLDGLISSSYFPGLVVWWCLVCLSVCPVCPCGLALGGSQDGPSCPSCPSCPGRAALPLPHPRHLVRSVCPAPQSTVSTACGLGIGVTSTFLFRFQGLLGKERDRARRPELGPEPLEPHVVRGVVVPDCSSAPAPPVSSGTVFSPSEIVGIQWDDSI